METYREYPIRCKTCNEPIACYSYQFENFVNSGLSIEDALDELGIFNYCSRNAMINPTIVAFNMENREVIEGFKSVDAADENDAQNVSTSRPIFTQCMTTPQTAVIAQSTLLTQGVNPIIPTLRAPIAQAPVQPRVTPQTPLTAALRQPPIGISPTPVQLRVQPTVPGMQTLGIVQATPRTPSAVPGMQTLGVVQATPRTPTLGNVLPTARPIRPVIPAAIAQIEQIIEPIIPGIDLDINLEALGDGIDVTPMDQTQHGFEFPTMVGVPTINPDPLAKPETVFVGAGKYVTILNGRTYLAQ